MTSERVRVARIKVAQLKLTVPPEDFSRRRRGRPRSPGSFSKYLTIPKTRSIAVTLNVYSLTTYASIYGDAYTGLSYAEA